MLPIRMSPCCRAELFTHYADLPLVRKAFHGLKPALVALIVVPLIEMTKNAKLNLSNFWVPLAAMVLVGLLGVSANWLILATIVFCVGQSLWLKRRLS